MMQQSYWAHEPETKPFSAMRWALEISMPWGFMASTAAAEKVEAGRSAENAAGLVAARRAVRANMVVVDYVREGGL